MKPLAIGSREDVAGFALAGVDGVVCATREDVEQAIARADEDTLFFVSAELAQFVDPAQLLVVLPAGS